MTRDLQCHLKSYIQPFERRLALLELRALSGGTPIPLSNAEDELDFRVSSRHPPQILANCLAYWESVHGNRGILTNQVIREATVNVVRNGVPLAQIRQQLPFEGEVPLANRRALRYGTHGIHEYRGKFFPQLVRSLINVAEVPQGGVVSDPMCGSGTTVVEAVLGGYRALGGDVNPLSVSMARTKSALLRVPPAALARAYEAIRSELLKGSSRRSNGLPYFRSLRAADQRYLNTWFSEQVLKDLDPIASTIERLRGPVIRDFMMLALSNILRSVSWQKEDDLRVRKEVRHDVEIDPIKEFLEEIGRSVRFVLALLYQGIPNKLGKASIEEVDACDLRGPWKQWLGKVDAVITSPPYATALPYLDTDRLSLCYLGLLSRPEHRKRDQLMIGNREITERVRRAYWQRFNSEKRVLPGGVVKLIVTVEELNSRSDVGFRRRNLPSLLAKYFLDMRTVLSNIRALLKTGRHAYVVVGDNHTIAGGQRVDIKTADLLAEVADSVGLKPEESIPMEMLVSRDIFRRNAVASEAIICLKNAR